VTLGALWSRSKGVSELHSIGNRRQFRPTNAPLSLSARRGTLAGTNGRGISQLSGRRRLIAPISQSGHKVSCQIRVLPLWEAFLIQMDDFDRLLELQLRRKLDAVVASPVPVRRRRAGLGRLRKGGRDEASRKRMGVLPIELRPDAFVFAEHS
jgi:hypothetical protein